MDCFLISHCIWEKPDQIDIVKEIISDTIRKHSYTLNLKTDLIKNEITVLEKEVDQETVIKTMLTEKDLIPVENKYYLITNYERNSD